MKDIDYNYFIESFYKDFQSLILYKNSIADLRLHIMVSLCKQYMDSDTKVNVSNVMNTMLHDELYLIRIEIQKSVENKLRWT